ncbi:hypothetical protein [Aurantiacibacter sediminis]|uniref:Glycerophosphoryl diester phosphodiesterase membrane domain-containing protein n=1 Tax=Aurantiacibacter sediminis TaxID=2793064 RepID=A0ABS0N4X7_9SPHN|nr:hypothetical protein [Aurantiacibacter sediminis]MBH5322846.1 hypothetical protein [Aurantiacibacter sediminis]
MAFIQEKQANVGELLGGAFRALGTIKRELAIYFLIFAALTLLPTNSLIPDFLFMLAVLAGYFVAQYMLYQAMLRKAGMMHDSGWRTVEFAVLAVLLSIPISIGLNFFVIPGLILIGKWIMAPTFLVARRQNLIEAIGDSWRASYNNTVHLTLAATLICTVWIIAFGVLTALAELAGIYFTDDLIWIWVHVLPVMLAGLSMAAYEKLSDETATLSEVFS